MAVVGAETFTVVREPGANLLILGGRENDIAIEIVSANLKEKKIVCVSRSVLGGNFV